MFPLEQAETGTQVPWAATSSGSSKRPCFLYVFISELGSFVLPDLTGSTNGGKNKKLSRQLLIHARPYQLSKSLWPMSNEKGDCRAQYQRGGRRARRRAGRLKPRDMRTHHQSGFKPQFGQSSKGKITSINDKRNAFKDKIKVSS